MRYLLTLLVLAMNSWAHAQPSNGPTPEEKAAADHLNRYFRRLTTEIADRCLADVKTLEDWQKQRPELRRQLQEMLGLLPFPEKTDLKATVTGAIDAGDFIVEKLHFQSRPRLYVTANFYRPKVVEKPLPTILYACGHGNVKLDGVSYGAKASYQHHPAWFARQGYCCLILDTLQLGEIEGEHHGTYRNNKWWWISRGYTPAGVEAWNCIRALDYLETRPEVDKSKIGMTGRSGGGAYTWWTAALDDRVACLVPVAGITDLENHVCDGCIEGHCDCMYLINTYQWDFATVAAMAAPRPLLFSNTDKDNIFPLDGVYRTFEKVKRIYDLHNAKDKLGLLITEGGHKDTQELQVPAFRWFNRWLMNKDEPITRLADKPLDPRQLKVFDKLPEDQLNTTVDEWFVPKAVAPPVPKTLAEWERTREGYLKDLKEKVLRNWPKDPPPLDVKVAATQEWGDYTMTALSFASEQGIRPAINVIGVKGLASPRAMRVVVVDDRGWQLVLQTLNGQKAKQREGASPPPDARLNTWLVKLLSESSTLVAVVLPRAVGPRPWGIDERKETHSLRRQVLLGRTQDDGVTWDAVRAVEALRQWAPKEVGEYRMTGMGTTLLPTVLASAWLPGISSLDLYEPVLQARAKEPAFIGVQRILPPAALLALALPARTNLHCVAPDDWEWAMQVARLHSESPLTTSPAMGVHTVEMVTELGDVVLELDGVHAPRTSWNFLQYVERGLFTGGTYHRTVTLENQPTNQVKIEVVQGGIDPARRLAVLPAIPLERTRDTGLHHLDGAISMARDGPDTATGDFFICIGDQPELDFGGKRNPDGQGFAAFGRVTKGMDVVRKIHQSPAEGQKLSPPIKIISIRRK